MAEVIYTDEFGAWWETLDEDMQDDVASSIGELEALGVKLGYPRSSQIVKSKHPLRELRIQSKGQPIRVIYAFDPKRQAVLIIGGNKKGDDRFYERIVPLAEKLWETYLDENA